MESCDRLKSRGGWWEDTFSKNCKVPIGPINTFTNIAYAWMAIIVSATVQTWPGRIFASALMLLAIGSALYHAYKTIPMSRLDHVGMYLVFGSLTIYSIAPTYPFIGPLMALGAIIFAVSLAYNSVWKVLLNPVLGICIFITTSSVAIHNSWKSAALIFGLFLIAYGIWNMDKKRTFPIPRWGHGLWHIITAIAIGLLFLNISGY